MREISLSDGLVTQVDDEDFGWLSKWNWQARRKKGRENAKFYACRGSGIRMHREILKVSPFRHVDHINGDTLDNRKSNLRICTRSQNAANTRVVRSTSGLKGVYQTAMRAKPWRAGITVEQRKISLGRFERAEDAARAYDSAALVHFGQFAATNVDLGLLPPISYGGADS